MHTAKVALLVEDDSDVAEFIQTWLRDELGLEIAVVEDGTEALNYLESVHPSLVIADLDRKHHYGHPPDPTKLKRYLHAHCIPVVWLSAYFTRHDQEDFGYGDLVSKPFDIDVLLAAIQKNLDNVPQQC
ncbi:MAG TPA: response regulator [Chloroflexota bacterium]|nr:response regulator [Chloroflexota bacterium]